MSKLPNSWSHDVQMFNYQFYPLWMSFSLRKFCSNFKCPLYAVRKKSYQITSRDLTHSVRHRDSLLVVRLTGWTLYIIVYLYPMINGRRKPSLHVDLSWHRPIISRKPRLGISSLDSRRQSSNCIDVRRRMKPWWSPRYVVQHNLGPLSVLLFPTSFPSVFISECLDDGCLLGEKKFKRKFTQVKICRWWP
jgi:hypothetical protein